MSNPTFTDVAVVGMHFREREGVQAKSIVANFVPPVSLDFEREPHNAYDAYAIKIFYKGQHIGYATASDAAYIAPYLDENIPYVCTVTHMEARGKNLHPITNWVPADEAEFAAEDFDDAGD